MALFDLARMTVASSGTGTITLLTAVPGFRTFDTAGCSTASAGQVVSYGISDTAASELGVGTYRSSSLTLTRGSSTTGLKSTNGNSPIDMSNTAQVFIAFRSTTFNVVTQVFTSTAAATYTPTTGMVSCIIECIGGGGGGGGALGTVGQCYGAGGGGAGSYSRATKASSQVGASQTVTVGSGGAGGSAGASNGNAGGDTSVGSFCIGKGGSGGAAGSGASASIFGGAGGISGTGDVTPAGAPGGGGLYSNIGTVIVPSGFGGNSVLGGGGVPNIGSGAAAGVAGSNYGSGGSGGFVYSSTSAVAGGNGSKGIVIITEYIMS